MPARQSRRTENLWARLTPELDKALNMRCAELGIKRPAAVERAIAAWLGSKSSVEESAEAAAGLSDEDRPLVEEFIRMLRDPGEKNIREVFGSYLRNRRRRREEAEETE